MEWKTRVTELLGSKYPIIQGAFAGFGTSAIAAPVSEAGGFGIITAAALRTAEGLRQDIRRARSMTDKPFGVNLTVGASASVEEVREVAIEEAVSVVETAGYRSDEHGRRLKEAGMKWIHKVATIRHALAAERQGADAVVIVGLEGDGFKSIVQLPTLTSIITAARLIKIPIIAAGGIGDARSFLAALVMGAEGVYIGTAFMATKECPIPDRYKEALVEAQPWDPRRRDRVLALPNAQEYQRIMRERGSIPQAQWLRRLEMVMFKESPDMPHMMEDPEEVLRIAGGSLAVGVIDKVVTVKELIDSIINGAEEVLATGLCRRLT